MTLKDQTNPTTATADSQFEKECTITYPPGIVLEHSIDGIVVDPYFIASEMGELKLSPTSEVPLPTLNEATLSEDLQSITVTAIFLVNTTLNQLNVKINQLFTIDNYGKYQLQFFIYCDELQLTEIYNNLATDTYKSYQVTFTTNVTKGFPPVPAQELKIENIEFKPGKITMENIELVQTFLWDIDPRTSRGTVTTVQNIRL